MYGDTYTNPDLTAVDPDLYYAYNNVFCMSEFIFTTCSNFYRIFFSKF